MLTTLSINGKINQLKSPENSTFNLILITLRFPTICAGNLTANIQHLER